MRLLNVTTERLESFYGDDIPRYAILSHTWGKEGDELLFKHVAGSDDDRREGKKRNGYLKLSAACKQARRDGWGYIWIDTCCINKESSAELSEAINSMYAWYQRSEVCYAYLEDMRFEDGISLNKSRWFTRGWTLQELVAPQRVVFYSSNWTDIGTKASLRRIISSVTGIRVEMITNYDPDKASVAEKMSWAAKRQTTRAEDIAYCLMGLFEVNMPLLYGEGKRAFRRLQEEIMKNSDDHSIFAWRTHHSRYGPSCLDLLSETRGMLAESPSDFLGAGDVVRSNNDGPYSAYSMSNRGLQIVLPIQPVNSTNEELIGINFADSQNIFKAILDCTYRDTSPTRWVVIYLKMVGKGRYVRIFPYWLNDTKMNPSEDGWVVTSLLIPQVNTSTISFNSNHSASKCLRLKIPPTKSGYSYQGQGWVEGGSYLRYSGLIADIFTFDREGKRFGVASGCDNRKIWIDILTEDDFEELSLSSNEQNVIEEIKSLYKEGGSRYHMVLQCSNPLCINVSKDHSVDASGKLASIYGLAYELTIDIREIIPEKIPTYGHFLDDFNPRNVRLNLRKEGIDWFAVYNPKLQRTLDVTPILGVLNEEPERIVLSPDAKYLATANRGEVNIYNTTTGDTTCVLSDEHKQYYDIDHMCFSPDSNRFAIYISENPIHISVWDIAQKHLLCEFTFQGWHSRVLRFTPDSRFIIAVPTGNNGMVQSLDVINGTSEDIWSWDQYYNTSSSTAISFDGRLVARPLYTSIEIWDVKNKQSVAELQERDRDANIMFTPDGKGLVGIKKDKALQYWDIGELATVEVKQGNKLYILPVNRPTSPRDVEPSSQDTLSSSIAHKYQIAHPAVSHDGRWIGTMSNIGIQFWDSRDGTLQFTLRNRTNLYNMDELQKSGTLANLLFDISSTSNTFATYTYGNNKVQIWKFDDINQS